MKKKSTARSAFFNPRTIIGLLSLVIALLVVLARQEFPGAALAQEGSSVNSGGSHKISVRDERLVENLKSQGARLIADYGSYQLLQVNDELANSLTNNRRVQIVDENNMVLLNSTTIDTRTPEAQALRSMTGGQSGKQMRLIQFSGPIRPEWYEALAATGVRIVTYIPSNTYLVYGTGQALQALHKFAAKERYVQWDGEYTSAYRLDPAVIDPSRIGVGANLSAHGNEQFDIQLVNDQSENATTLGLVEQLKLEPIVQQDAVLGYINVRAALSQDSVRQIAERGDVVSVHPWVTPVMMCERQDQIMAGNLTGNSPTPGDYLAYLTSKGYNLTTPASFGVNISDSGLDNGTTTPFQFLLYNQGDPTNPTNSRVVYVTAQGTAAPADLQGCHGHGNINTTIIGGYVPTGTLGGVNFGAPPHADASGFRWGLGMAPFVKLGMSVIFSTGGTYTNPNIRTLESNAYQASMRVSSNSWGAPVNGAYDSQAQLYDSLVRDAQAGAPGNQEYTIVFSAGNNGSGATTIGSPGTAKNLITVGAAEDVNPFGGSDGCGTSDAQANSANDIIGFSSRGPTTDMRIKPDIMGPGTHVSGGAPQNSLATPTGSGTGTVLACFNGGGVCGGVGSNFFPSGQQWYTASSGTSHSCPAVAGAAALIRQHFINQSLTPPSPAMVKGIMMNSARYMNGVGANDNLFSNNQGMGETSMNNYFDIFASAHILRDEVTADLFTASGQQYVINGSVVDSGKPMRVTVAWTDPPGPTSGNAFVNNLDLEVTVGGSTYFGNNFAGAFSISGGSANTRDNVESVFLPAGTTGPVTIKVTATNIAGDGVPGNGQPLDQDYALIVYNVGAVAMNSGAVSVAAESCPPGNGAVDPGETVTMNFGLGNGGSTNTTNLVATLQESGGVVAPGAPQTYGAVAAGAEVARPFTFTAGTGCGETITATFQLQDGATDLGFVRFTFPTGVSHTESVTSENFDGVTAPALPAGWTSAATGAELAWVTSTTNPNLGPNAAFAPDVSGIGTSELVPPAIAVPSGDGFQLGFRNVYNLENGFDGMVLEISVGGGAFTDIITAGGSFITGGYNSTIATNFQSPIAGRMAWSGRSAGTSSAPVYIDTKINLPPSASGQSIQLKWIVATDFSGVATGQAGARIDDVSVAAAYFACCAAATPSPTASPTATPTASPTATVNPSAQALNLSTRLLVQVGENVGVAGFIIAGSESKQILIRGLGPSLGAAGVPNALANPALTLSGSGGFVTLNNSNWKDTQQQEIMDTGIPPSDDLESAILVTLPPGSYTAIIKGEDDGTGAALVELYDLSPNSASKLGNISTRAFVSTGSDIVIAGFILGNNTGTDKVVIRGIGPSLGDFGVANPLADPTLELRNANGAPVGGNNDWNDFPPAALELQTLGLAPSNLSESAIVKTLAPGSYTALLSGVGGTTGVGLIEVYDNPGQGPTPGPTGTPGPTPTPGGETPTPAPTAPPQQTPTPPPGPSATPGVCTETFDGVTAPALPAGWVASNPVAGDGVMFVTTTTTSDSAPNNAFIPDQADISDKVLDRQVTINSTSPVLTFRNNFNTEFSDGVFWDGGVLEISSPNISGGDFLDVTDSHIGGSITSGGYTGEISGDASNPLAGRMAWSGNSGGYIDTVINLGPNLNGQTITVRFRMGTDEAEAAPGWHIDGLSITGASCQ